MFQYRCGLNREQEILKETKESWLLNIHLYKSCDARGFDPLKDWLGIFVSLIFCLFYYEKEKDMNKFFVLNC